MSVSGIDKAKWGKGHALWTMDGDLGIPVLVSAELNDQPERMLVTSPVVNVRKNGERIFTVKTCNLVRLLPGEFYNLLGMKPGDQFPPVIDLDDFELVRLSSVRHAAPEAFDFSNEENPYTA
ncbi:hypothetical protein NLN96_18930 [Citrobacter portucalensis]|uniref:hypothetical protein n=1 Tax=Citrobacter portucalensis TaxID=1639133 RepID=UPI00226B46A3|nr:hypothetical protein [Citrobacter portucalensis]MCX9019072.1 hypothetical protein [Citrobacter portucalensis]